MIERNEAYTKMIAVLYAKAERLERGDVLDHETIRGVVGVGPHEGHWQHCVNKVRRRLQKERGIASWPVHGVGYKLLTVQEQAEMLPRKRLARAGRQVRRARASLAALPDGALTFHQRRLKAAQAEMLRQAGKSINSQRRAQEALARKPSVNPRAERRAMEQIQPRA